MPEPRLLKTIFTYPWDLHDDGPERALDMIQNDARLNGVSLAVAYHVSTYFLPHNPRRKIYYGEDGMVLFQPEAKRWARTKLRPHVSQVVENRDWLPRLAEAVRKRGLHLTAWTVYLYNHYLARTYPTAAKQDALGNAYLAQLCPANPQVRQYALALTDDVMANVRPDALYIESLSYLPFGYGFRNPKVLTPITPRAEFLLALCFCPHCIRAAGRGLDALRFKADVAAWLERELPRMPAAEDMAPADEKWQNTAFDSRLAHYLAARAETASALFEEVVQRARSFGDVRIETEFPTPGGRFRAGLVPQRILKVTDRLGVGVPAQAAQVKARRKEAPATTRLLANVQPSHATSAAALARTVAAARKAGVDGFTFYNFGLLRLDLKQARVPQCQPTVNRLTAIVETSCV